MITLNPIPAHAMRVTFMHRGLARTYHVWSNPNSTWSWSAAGKQDNANTRTDAEAQARRWIRDGQ